MTTTRSTKRFIITLCQYTLINLVITGGMTLLYVLSYPTEWRFGVLLGAGLFTVVLLIGIPLLWLRLKNEP